MIGAGLVGLFIALQLSKMGYKSDIYEKRPVVFTSEGRRSPLILNYRALVALYEVGINHKKFKEFAKITAFGLYKTSLTPL